MIDPIKMTGSTIRGSCIVEDHAFPSIAAYKAYLQVLRLLGIDFYIFSFGPDCKARIGLGLQNVPMIECATPCNFDPAKDNY